MNDLISFLENQDVEYLRNKSLSCSTSVGIGGVAKMLVYPSSMEKFIKTICFLSENRFLYRVVGNMTNVLFSDEEIKTVLVSTLKMNKYSIVGNRITAEAGVMFSKLIQSAAKVSIGGAEALFGIPGTVGAMLSINAGAYGSSISDFLSAADLIIPQENCVFTLKKDDIAFFYRDSEIKRQGFVVLSAVFDFLPLEKQNISSKIRETQKKRKDTQPVGFKTLGSVFKRSDILPASYMIDRCGLKGKRIGNVSVSTKHAGFFVNEGGGTAQDFLSLVRTVKDAVHEKYGVVLEEEFEYLT